MKIHADPTHSAYHHAISTCRVFLEGAERNNVIFADEEGRRAITQRLDEFGRPVMKKGEIQTDQFWGSVRIECPQWVREQCEGGINFTTGGVLTHVTSPAQAQSLAQAMQAAIQRAVTRHP